MTIVLGTCVACGRPQRQVERIVRSRMELLVCIDSAACMARWREPKVGGYTGDRPAAEVNPPQRLPSASITAPKAR